MDDTSDYQSPRSSSPFRLLPQRAVHHMPIGVVGYAGHGKDTVADILVTEFGYHKIAFADPLRDFCEGLFGLSRDQMLDRVLKEKELCDHAWPFATRSQFRSRIARPLSRLAGVPLAVVTTHMNGGSAPDPLVAIANGLPISHLCRQVSDRIATYIEPLIFVGVNPLQIGRPSPRVLLQTIGTEVFRAICPTIWAAAWVQEAQHHDGKVVASDARFSSEIDALRHLNGTAVRVDATKRLGPVDGVKFAHPSEAMIPQLPVSRIFTNDGTMSELMRQVSFWARVTLLSEMRRQVPAGDPA